MSAHTASKAIRLLAEGAVEPVDHGPLTRFTVRGDTGSYTTIVGATIRMCTCKQWRERMVDCSHIEAGVAWVNATDDEKGLMRAALERRKMLDVDRADGLFARLGA